MSTVRGLRQESSPLQHVRLGADGTVIALPTGAHFA